MMFCVDTERSDVVDELVSSANRRSGIGFFVKIYSRSVRSRVRLVVFMENSFPPMWRYLSLGILGGVFVFRGLTPLLLLGFVPLFVEVFLTARFQRFLFTRGLRKRGYTGAVDSVSDEEVVRWLINA